MSCIVLLMYMWALYIVVPYILADEQEGGFPDICCTKPRKPLAMVHWSSVIHRVSVGREGDRGQTLPLLHISRPCSEKAPLPKTWPHKVNADRPSWTFGWQEGEHGTRQSRGTSGFGLWSFLWLSLKFSFYRLFYLFIPCPYCTPCYFIYTVCHMVCVNHFQYIRCLVFTCLMTLNIFMDASTQKTKQKLNKKSLVK